MTLFIARVIARSLLTYACDDICN